MDQPLMVTNVPQFVALPGPLSGEREKPGTGVQGWGGSEAHPLIYGVCAGRKVFWFYHGSRHCAAPDWIRSQEGLINGETDEIQIKSGLDSVISYNIGFFVVMNLPDDDRCQQRGNGVCGLWELCVASLQRLCRPEISLKFKIHLKKKNHSVDSSNTSLPN